jgi:hypothetical protein
LNNRSRPARKTCTPDTLESILGDCRSSRRLTRPRNGDSMLCLRGLDHEMAVGTPSVVALEVALRLLWAVFRALFVEQAQMVRVDESLLPARVE